MRQEFASQVIFWLFNGMKSVTDRFDGMASELGREELPRDQRKEYLAKMGSLLAEFPGRFPLELLSGKRVPAEWKRVSRTAQRCQAKLAEQCGILSGLEDGHSDSRHKIDFQA